VKDSIMTSIRGDQHNYNNIVNNAVNNNTVNNNAVLNLQGEHITVTYSKQFHISVSIQVHFAFA
jgi:hypothetical protein